MKLPYFDQFRLPEQAYRMVTARNLGEMKKALSLFQLMEQNVMVATVDGDIFYVRNGRVPIRPKGFDWTRPVPGNTSATRVAGLPPARRPGAVAQPVAGLHAELQRLARAHDRSSAR